MLKPVIRIGTRVQVTHCSGVHSGKVGNVVSFREVKLDGRGVPELPGEYRPIDRARQRCEVFVRLIPDGEIISMFVNRLEAVEI